LGGLPPNFASPKYRKFLLARKNSYRAAGWLARKSLPDATTAIFKCAASMHFRLGGSGRVTLGRAH